MTNGVATALAASSVGGALTVDDKAGSLSQSGALSVGRASSFTTEGSNATITLTNASNALTGAVALDTTGSLGAASLTNGVATVLAASSVGGTLTVDDKAGSLSQSGALIVGGTSVFITEGSNATITLADAGNLLTGAVTLGTVGSSGAASVTNGVTTVLAAMSIGGALTVDDKAGSLSQSGALSVGGASSFTTEGSNATITLTNASNALTGAVALDTTGPLGAASLTNGVATVLAASSVGGTLTVDDKVGSLSQSGALIVGGTSSFTTEGSNATITLADAGNLLTGAVTLGTVGSSGDASMTNGVTTVLAAMSIGGALTVDDKAGSLSQSGALTVGGASSFTTEGSNATITLANANNELSGAVTLATTGASADASLTNDATAGTILAASSVGRSLTVIASTGDVSKSGSVVAVGDLAIEASTGSIRVASTLQSISGNVFLEAPGSGATIATAGGMIALDGGALSLAASAGVGTASEPIRVTDAAALTIAGAAETGGWFASVSSPAASGAAVTVATVTPPSFFATVPVAGIAVATNGDVGLQNAGGTATGGAIVLASDIDLSRNATGNVFLETGGTIAGTGGVIRLDGGGLSLFAAGGLGTSAAGLVVTDAAPLTVAAATATGGVYLNAADAAGLTVGQGPVTPAFFNHGTLSGLVSLSSTGGGDVSIENETGSVTLASTIDLSQTSGNVFIDAAGTIETTGGAIALGGGALSLVADAGVGTASQPIRVIDTASLTLAGATETGGWYASVSSPASVGAPVTVGTVTLPSFFATASVTGITTATSGDVGLQIAGGTATGGAIVLASDIDLSGNVTGSVYLETAGTIATGGGVIKLDGGALSLVAATGVGTANQPIRVIDAASLTLAGAAETGGWYASVSSPAAAGAAVVVGAVTPPEFFATMPVAGIAVATSGDVGLQNAGGTATGGAIVLADDIDLSGNATGNVFLETGATIASAGGVIRLDASDLSLVATGGIRLGRSSHRNHR